MYQQLETTLKGKPMKTYQAFAQVTKDSEFILTEVKYDNIELARIWFDNNTFEHETVYLKKVQ